MKKVFASHDIILVGLLRSALVERGIPCLVKNEHLGGGAGEIPPIECWPELWVLEDGDLELAMGVVESIRGEQPKPVASWVCRTCGEHLEGQFEWCWRCGAGRND